MSEYIRLGLAKDVKGLRNILPNSVPGLYGLGYSLPAYCQKEDDFIGATFVLNVMSEIEDNLPRNEILSVALASLFKKTEKTGSSKLIKKILKSEAYRKVRKTTMEFSDISAI